VGAVARHHCTTAVVDVSMEVTVLMRLLGLRVVTVRQSGRRDDAPHRTGLATADVVWVPQHRSLEPVDGDVDDRWAFTGPFSRFDGEAPGARPPSGRRRAVIMLGAGGSDFVAAAWRDAEPPAGWDVAIVGAGECWAGAIPSLGRVEAVHPLLQGADVVVTSGGWAAVADVVAAGARLVVVPERRPFDEQAVRAEALVAHGLARCLAAWPTPAELRAVLADALTLDPLRWHRYHDRAGARRAADLVDGVHAA
jgi:UDP:flavonoid glycosyltransferase YjiC (YdhE family)